MRGATERTREEARGIYTAWYRIDGCEVLYAVTSAGERLKKIIVLRPGVSEERAIRWLEDMLDRVDPPRPALTLVKDEPRRSLTPEEIDALYRDADRIRHMLWRRRRAAARGQLRRFD